MEKEKKRSSGERKTPIKKAFLPKLWEDQSAKAEKKGETYNLIN